MKCLNKGFLFLKEKMLKSKYRLKKRKEFGFIYKNAKRVSSNNFHLYYIDTKLSFLKIGFAINKKVGKAVVRNKIKRRLREICKENLKDIKKKNYVISAKIGAANLNFNQIKEEITFLFKKANLFLNMN